MAEIPADVMKEAEKAFKYGFGLRYEVAIEAIARAVMAERERCNEIRTALKDCRDRLSMQNHRLNENLIARCDQLLGKP